MCVFIALKGHFYDLFIFARTQGLAKLLPSLTDLVKKWWEKRYFNCMLPFQSLLHVMSLYKARQETSITGTSFPAGVHSGSSFLDCVHKGLLSLFWCLTGSFLSRRCFTDFFLKFCHSNQTKWTLVIKHSKMIITATELPLPKKHLYQIGVLLLQWFLRCCPLKYSFFFFFLKK